MSNRVKNLPPALRHAAYSATTILPGESRAEFEKLHKELIAEFNPEGRYEEDIVGTMARLIWRKQHLDTFRVADVARRRCNEIESEIMGSIVPEPFEYNLSKVVLPEVREAAVRAVQSQKEQELGEA